MLSAGLLVPSRQEAAGAIEICKGVPEAHLSFLPGLAEIYGCPHWISTAPAESRASPNSRDYLVDVEKAYS